MVQRVPLWADAGILLGIAVALLLGIAAIPSQAWGDVGFAAAAIAPGVLAIAGYRPVAAPIAALVLAVGGALPSIGGFLLAPPLLVCVGAFIGQLWLAQATARRVP